jgi:hypothetical protein
LEDDTASIRFDFLWLNDLIFFLNDIAFKKEKNQII